MRKSKEKIIAGLAAFACVFSAAFGGALWNRSASASGEEKTMPTASLIGKTTSVSSVAAAKTVTLTNSMTNTVTGLSLAPQDHTGAWSAEINATFTGDTSITYFLPNQYGSNGKEATVANAFSVKDADGDLVAVFVNSNSHWSSLASGKAYVYDALTETYTTKRTKYTDSANRYETDETLTTLTPSTTSSNHISLTGFGDDHYVSPKIGTQFNAVPVNADGTTANGTGTVYFEYAENTLKIKTTTYRIASRVESYGETVAGAGQTVTLGVVENVDLSDGYTISVGSAPSVAQADETTTSYPYSSSVIITDINGVAMTGETLEYTGNPQSIYYEGEKIIGGENTVALSEGEELGQFSVSGNFLIGGKIASNTVAELYKTSATEIFKDKAAGEYPVTITAGNVEKAYNVVVKKVYQTLTSDLIGEVSNNVSVTTEKALGDYTGIFLDVNGMTNAWSAEINAKFIGASSISYLLPDRADHANALGSDYNRQANSFVIKNADGETVLVYTIMTRHWTEIYTGAYVYDAVNDKYMTVNSQWSNGYGEYLGYEVIDPNKIVIGTGVETTKVLPKAGVVGEDSNTGAYPVLDGKFDGTLIFEYDAMAKTMTVKTVAADIFDETDATNAERNADTHFGNGQTVVVGVVENVDLSGGYTISAQNAATYGDSEDENYFEHTHSSDVLITEINGVSMGNATVPVTAGSVTGLSMLGNTYVFDEAEATVPTVYAAKNGGFGELSATTYKQYKLNWVEYVSSNEVSISGNYDLATAGTYAVTVDVRVGDMQTSKIVDLVVEDSQEIKFDANGGRALPSIYLSEHCYNFELPTPERFGWKFVGWYDGETKVTAIVAGMEAVTLKAEWLDDAPPVVGLNGLNSLTVVDKSEDFKISATDVLAEDMGDGVLTDIVIEVKAPNAAEFIAYSNFTFDNTLFGEYEIKYTATDVSGNFASVTRTIKYMQPRPVLTVDGEVPTGGFIGKEITLPTATAVSGNDALTIAVAVAFNGDVVSVTGNKFVPTEAGTYSVSYSATNASGLSAAQTFEIVVISDTEAPVLEVEFTVTEILLGAALTIPTATATDNAGTDVTISVKVLKNGKEIASGVNSVTFQEEGVYTVVYTATDEVGNSSSRSFEVFAKKKSTVTDTTGGTAGGGCGGSVATLGVSVGLAALAFAILKKKKENK